MSALDTTKESKLDALLDSKPGTWKDWKPHDFHELVDLARQLEEEVTRLREYEWMYKDLCK